MSTAKGSTPSSKSDRPDSESTTASSVPSATAQADDLDLGSFSEVQPWSLRERPPRWRSQVPALRRRQHQELPSLIRPPRVPPVGRGATVLGVVGGHLAIWAVTERGRSTSRAGISRRIRVSAERLGPTFIKLAQIISAGDGVFPAELVNECKKCRDQVPAVSYHDIIAVVESELRRPLHEIFRSFDPEPLAAASIAQVHTAVLRSGEPVVVKVQRPGIDHLIRQDLRVLAWLAPKLVGRIPVSALANPPALVELFAETIIEELDFRVEAANMLDVAEVLVALGQTGFVIPRPHPEFVTEKVLVMQRLDGFRFDDGAGMTDAGIDTEAVIRTGMLGFLEGALLHGIFHGDLHGGNLFVQPDGRTALLDFGITGRLTQPERLAFLRLMMTGTMNDMTGQIAALRDLGALPPDTDIDAVVRDLGLDRPPMDPTAMAPEELIAELQRVMKALLGYGARLPKPLMLYVKNMIFLDGAISSIAPNLDLMAVITEIATHFATEHGATIATELGVAESDWQLDLSGVKAGFGIDADHPDSLTYAELQARRDLIRRRMSRRN